MITTNDVLNLIQSKIKSDYLEGSKLSIRNNLSYNSIIITSKKTAYRSAEIGEILFARIKETGRPPYASFSQKYLSQFQKLGLVCNIKKSDKLFFYMPLEDFYSVLSKSSECVDLINTIFLDAFSFAPFGCCSSFEKCSDQRRCIHPDRAYSTACQYRKNLEQGKIFYGKNKNIGSM